jgi:two-component system sensor histidine kinase KdpD
VDAGRPERVDVRVPETLPMVVVDGPLLERAVANVVANALAVQPADAPVVVEAAAIGDHVHLRVVDRGPGIAPALRDRVFEPFQRLGDRSTQAGVGLGLAIAQGLTRAVGGELELEDTAGGGLTVVFRLPVTGEEAEPVAADDGLDETEVVR